MNCTGGGRQGVDRRHQLHWKVNYDWTQKASPKSRRRISIKKKSKKKGINWIIKRRKKGPKNEGGSSIILVKWDAGFQRDADGWRDTLIPYSLDFRLKPWCTKIFEILQHFILLNSFFLIVLGLCSRFDYFIKPHKCLVWDKF